LRGARSPSELEKETGKGLFSPLKNSFSILGDIGLAEPEDKRDDRGHDRRRRSNRHRRHRS